MKTFIVILSTVILGLTIYQWVAGPQDDSIKSVVTDVFRYQIESQETYP